MQVKEYQKKQKLMRPKEEVEAMIKKARKEADRMVKGKFEFIDAQGGWIDFTYRMWPGEPIMQFKFVHGEVCEIPMGVVKHINNTVKKVRKLSPELALNARGVPSSYETQSRIRFTPSDYL